MDDQICSFLSKVGLFSDLSNDDLDAIAKMGRVQDIPQNEVVLSESSHGKEMFAIMSGRIDVKLIMPSGAESESIATLKEGDIFGESILLGKTRRIADVIARDKVKIVMWDCTQLLSMFEEDTKVGFVVMRNLARIVHERLTSTNMLLRNTLNRVIDLI